ncbi:glycosyltransferase family 2 protein [Mucilaginibacter flavus]|uniref:glycosyltransferase family 2 protein n=1 Tax=Mucilaginibacter flavus TaxID=931504 RepID=UPI0025B4F488|nr:glycosyltransferase family A protein [Mucilaginibacter flavus]MDN3583739.1 glycosyltransferase family A protein [Mucilaginibacter flavus]
MFSIIIPAFKTKYLFYAIKSVLDQTFEDFELIIVNDKSPENVAEIVAKFEDKRISYYENENNLGSKSVVSSWNNCLKYAKFEYTLLFSDDDILEPDFLLEINELIKQYPLVDLFYSRVAVIDQDNKIIRYTCSAPEREVVLDFIWHRLRGLREIYAPNFVFRTKSLIEIGGFVDFPLAWGSDDATWFSLAKTNGVVSTNKVLCNWRWSELNISKIGNVKLRLNAIETFLTWVANFVNSHDSRNAFETELKQEIFVALPLYKDMLKKSLIQRLFENNTKLDAVMLFLKYKGQYKLPYSTFLKSIMVKKTR